MRTQRPSHSVVSGRWLRQAYHRAVVTTSPSRERPTRGPESAWPVIGSQRLPVSSSRSRSATAVKLSELPGVAVQDVAESLYIHPFMLSRWRKQAREGRIVTKGVEVEKDVAAELKALRRMKKDYERLKLEHELLKKAIEFTSAQKRRSSPSSSTTRTRSR